jgi:hypothetical protein
LPLPHPTTPNTQEIKNRFKNEEIEDILLVMTYAGRTPAWPVKKLVVHRMGLAASSSQRGRNLMVFRHSSASMLDQMSIKSSAAIATDNRCGIINTPGLVSAVRNAAKCLGMVF